MNHPNSLRNRWRRMHAAYVAYGWNAGTNAWSTRTRRGWSTLPSLREYATNCRSDSYSASVNEMAEYERRRA